MLLWIWRKNHFNFHYYRYESNVMDQFRSLIAIFIPRAFHLIFFLIFRLRRNTWFLSISKWIPLFIFTNLFFEVFAPYRRWNLIFQFILETIRNTPWERIILMQFFAEAFISFVELYGNSFMNFCWYIFYLLCI